ncbi:hypothetical protein [Intestinimonas massiliensis (ex Afouda et al. 2020)]|uniref:hypothetical protein n=1 Tax=Intestinimonas massiliensis (ex Afouda et al. 2020) TaxID=1673721 RepID=UPI001030F071|nr:hypothetical protein [Intestinimonas massiliensis (ex Afouda et al. 2020)]
MKTITASPGIVLSLGREGENAVRQVIFDITDWHSEFGADGTVALLAQRPGETEPYPVDIVVSGSAVTWLVSAADTAKPGIYGQAELQYRIGDVVVKSAIWRTFIADSLGGPSPEPPEPQQAWVDQVMDAAQTVETAVVNGPKIQDGNWWVWDFESERYVDTGVAASNSYTLPTATSVALGGVKAGPAQAGDTQPVRIGKNGMLYTAGAKNPVHINLASYGAPVVLAVLSMIESGIKEYALPLPDAPEILALIAQNPDNAFFDMTLPSASSMTYSAAVSGYTLGPDSSTIVWADAKIAIYLDNQAGITGWIGGYLGILPAQPDAANLLIRLTDVPGSG